MDEAGLYDITPIPQFPFVPGGWLWLLPVIVLAGALVYLFFTRTRRSRPARARALFQRELDDMLRRESSPNERARRASLLGRRYLSAVTDGDFAALTPKELRAEADRASSEEAGDLLRALAELGEASWSPELSDEEASSERIAELVDRLDRKMTADAAAKTS